MDEKEAKEFNDKLSEKANTFITFVLVNEKKISEQRSFAGVITSVKGDGLKLIQMLKNSFDSNPAIAQLFIDAITYWKMEEMKDKIELEKARNSGKRD